MSDQSAFGRHELTVQSKTKLCDPTFPRSQAPTSLKPQLLDPLWARSMLGGVTWQPAGCLLNTAGEETDLGQSWLQSTLASGSWK